MSANSARELLKPIDCELARLLEITPRPFEAALIPLKAFKSYDTPMIFLLVYEN